MIINGGSGSEALNGTADDDTFYTGGGAHTMYGHAGNDTYYVDNASARVMEAAGEGTDTVYASVSYTLASAQEVEFLRVWGAAANLTLTGNQLANHVIGGAAVDTLNGGAGDDTLDGGAGADVMSGGSGNDTFYVDNAGDQVIEAVGGGSDTVYATANWTMAVGQEIETLRVSGSVGLTLGGNDMANALFGGSAADTLGGGGGNDRLDGGAGADVMSGGSGDDSFTVDNAGDKVIEAAGGGSDTVYTVVSYTLGAGQAIETLRASGAAGLTLGGNELANALYGSSAIDTLNGGGGNDRLDGGAGADTMAGGSGDDTFYVDNAGDQVIEAAGGGTDTVYTTVSYTLGAGQEVETVQASGSGSFTLTGNELANVLVGAAGSDTLNGGAGKDRLNGGVGADVMTGGSDNDVYFVDNAGDQVIEAAGGGTDTVYAAASYTLAAGQEIEALRASGSAGLTLIGNAFANYVVGGAGNDVLKGGDGDDGLDGGAGDDTLFGGQGADKLNGNTGIDWVSYDTAGLAVTANLATGQGSGGSAQGDTYTSIENLRGGNANDTLIGNALANQLAGGAGNDTLDGGAGDDRLDGGLGADRMTGGSGNDSYTVDNAGDQVIEAAGGGTDTIYTSINYTLAAGLEIEAVQVSGTTAGLTLTGNALANVLVGGSGADRLNGGAGKDRLNGGAGADVMTGGSDNDVYFVDNAGDQVIEAVGGGNDTVYATAGYTLAAGQEIEALRASGSAGLTLIGNAFANNVVGGTGNDILKGGDGDDGLDGGAGDDTLFGGQGADKLNGNTGNDWVSYDTAGLAVTANLATGQGSGGSAQGDTYTSIENLRGGNANDTLIGDAFANQLAGGAGNDTLDGGAGDDTLEGGAGADSLTGGTGTDRLSYAGSAAGVTVNLAAGTASGGDATGDTYSGFEGVDGSAFADTLTGDGTANRLGGGGGNDRLDGAGGADTMTGGSGDDTYYVDNAADQVIEAVGGGTDTVYTVINYALGAGQEVEALRASGSASFTLTGNELANALYGSSAVDTLNGGGGNDRLDGAAGADVMTGGSGNDSYYVDNAGDKVIEAAGGGSDTVYATIDYTLASGQDIETLRVSGSAARTLTGNALANTLIGGAGADTLNGAGGADVLDGGLGADIMAGGSSDDTYYVDNAGDQVIEAANAGTDTVYASASWTMAAGQAIERLRAAGSVGVALGGNELVNFLYGASANDTLSGGGGNDRLEGGLGADVMTGGAGNDTFYVDNAGDQVIEEVGGGSDTVYTTVDWAMAAGQEIEQLSVSGSVGLALSGNEQANALKGGAGGDTLSGGGGNDTLDGGVGADVMTGGSGDDLFLVDNVGDQVIEAAGGGNDRINTTVDWTASAGQEIESVHAYGAARHLTGNDFGMELVGSSGDDTVTGGAGDDDISGGYGSDTLYGGGGSDTLDGGEGYDILDGGTGADTMIDGEVYYIDNVGDKIVQHYDVFDERYLKGTAYTSIDLVLGDDVTIASLRVTGSAGLHLTANNPDPSYLTFGSLSLYGGVGNDTLTAGHSGNWLDGGAGADTLVGGAGDDIFVVDNSADQVIGGSEADNLYAVGDYTLAAGLQMYELSVFTGAGIHLTGNDLAHAFVGGDGDDTLTGGAGNDNLRGLGGADIMDGGAGDDALYNDTLYGEGGDDIMTGGAGADTFGFFSPLGVANSASITDFDGTEDTIRLRPQYFVGLSGQLTAAQFSTNGPTGTDPQIVYDQASGILSYASGGTQTQFGVLLNHATLSASDFTVN